MIVEVVSAKTVLGRLKWWQLWQKVAALRFTGSNSWHTYAYSFIIAIVTYKGMLPIHCMQASLW